MTWIAEHSELINLLINIGMLVVWVAYLQVFLAGYKRHRKAKILINPGGGKGLEARCLVTNMSAEPIYIHALLARLDGPSGTMTFPVTEPDKAEHWQAPSDLKLWTRQGPLEKGKVRDMGAMQLIFDHIRSESLSVSGVRLVESARQVELQVLAVYGSEDVMVAARRRFRIERHQDAVELHPLTLAAEQVTSRRERRRIVQILEARQTAETS